MGLCVGDIVTRGGDDEQVVKKVTEDGYLVTVECVVEPESGWIKKGEVEDNLASRYELIRKGCEYSISGYNEDEFCKLLNIEKKQG